MITPENEMSMSKQRFVKSQSPASANALPQAST